MTIPPLVLKIGGDELLPGPTLAELAMIVARAVRSGRAVVVVHGGGDEVTERAAALGLATEKRDGQRVTSAAMLGVVVEVLAGRVNARLVNALAGAGVPAVGVSGLSAALLPVSAAGDPPGSLGWVGEPGPARVRILQTLLSEGYTPVVAPIGTDTTGGVYNVNADLAAAAIASALRADLNVVTDVDGVRDAGGAPVRSLTVAELPAFLATGAATGGMLPKLDATARAVRDGAASAWIGRLADLGTGDPAPGAGTRIGARRAPSPHLPLPASSRSGDVR